MIYYRLFTERVDDPEPGEYETYGIIAADASGDIRIIRDITCEAEKAKGLVDLYNEEQLSITHLDEAIESFLYDFEV